MLRTARDVIATGDVRTIVDYGIELDRRIKSETIDLEQIKEYVRTIGAQGLDRCTEKTVRIDGNVGVVTITYPSDGPVKFQGVNLLEEEKRMPAYLFERFFIKKTVVDFADSFPEKLALLESEEDRKQILSLVAIMPRTPRVTWPK